jgi:hypothetical protein
LPPTSSFYNCIGGIMVSVIAPCEVDHETRWGKNKDFIIVSFPYAVLSSKRKDWFCSESE